MLYNQLIRKTPEKEDSNSKKADIVSEILKLTSGIIPQVEL
jgi:hypothetical protein